MSCSGGAPRFTKDPDATLDYLWDWTSWLGDDEIAFSNFFADLGIIIGSETNTATTATVWLAGGTPGVTYRVTNRITTVQGREDDRTAAVTVRQR